MIKTKQFKFDGIEYKVEPFSLQYACDVSDYTDKQLNVPHKLKKEAVLSCCFYREDEKSAFIQLTEVKLTMFCMDMHYLLELIFREAQKLSITDDKKKIDEFFSLMRALNPKEEKESKSQTDLES